MSKLYFRSATVDTSAIDIERRTVQLAFSSEAPVVRDFGLEILSHDPADIDTTFIASGTAPLLVEHERSDQIGVIESTTIDTDRKGRAIVRFSQSARGQEYFNDVVDGIRKNVSVGYAINDYEVRDTDNGPVAIVKWTPIEISIVSIPADTNVGIGRSESSINKQNVQGESSNSSASNGTRKVQKNQIKQKTQEKQEQETKMKRNKREAQEVLETIQDEFEIENVEVEQDEDREDGEGVVEVEDETNVQEAVKAERARVAQLTELATRHAVDATGAIRNGMSVNKFRAHVLDCLGSSNERIQTGSQTLGMTRAETKRYSLGNAVRALATGDWSDAGLELEASRAAARAQNKVHTAQSLFIPVDYLQRDAGANALKPSVQTNLVSTDYRDQSFMDVLFAKTIAAKLGVQFQDGLSGVVEIPKFATGATARFVGTGVDGTIDSLGDGVVTLSPKSVIALVELTRSMVQQGSRMLEQWVTAHLQNKIAEALDAAVFGNATGANAPTGLKALAGLTKPAGAPTPLTWVHIRNVIKAVENANADSDVARWAMGPNVSAMLESTEKAASTGIYLRGEDGKVAGRDSLVSTNVGDNIWFGDFSNVMVGSWSSIELAIDTSQKFASGGWLIRAITDADVGLLRPEAFSGYKALSV